MMIDHRIPMMGQAPQENFFTGLQQGQQYKANALAMDSARQGMQQQRVQFNRQSGMDIAKGVLSAPAAQRPQAYKAALQEVQRQGGNIADLPEDYSEDVDLMLRMYAGGEQESTGFLRELQAAGIDPASKQGRDLLLSRYGALEDGPSPTTGMREYELARQQGFQGNFVEYQAEVAKAKKPDDFEIIYGPDGNPILQRGNAAQAAKPLREFEAKAVQFNERMSQALPRVEAAEEALMRDGGPSLLDSAADALGAPGNFLKSAEGQAYKTAALEWIAAILRLDSGAAVPETEFQRYYKSYFFEPGDSEQTRENKRRARETVMDAISRTVPEEYQSQRRAPTESAPRIDVRQLSDEELLRNLGR